MSSLFLARSTAALPSTSLSSSKGIISSSDAREDDRIKPTLSPRVVEVTTVDAIVVDVTDVGRLDIPSVSPRTARVEIP